MQRDEFVDDRPIRERTVRRKPNDGLRSRALGDDGAEAAEHVQQVAAEDREPHGCASLSQRVVAGIDARRHHQFVDVPAAAQPLGLPRNHRLAEDGHQDLAREPGRGHARLNDGQVHSQSTRRGSVELPIADSAAPWATRTAALVRPG